MADTNYTTVDQVGWRVPILNLTTFFLQQGVPKSFIYYIDATRWKDVCGSYAPVATAQALKDRGYLITEAGGELTVRKTFISQGRKRYYAIKLHDEEQGVATITSLHPRADEPEQSATHECEANFG